MNSFLEIDYKIFEDNPNDIYRGKSIYLIGYPKDGMATYSMGLIKDINEGNYEIRHLCKTNPGSSGCPIINLNNNRVIGINKRVTKIGNWNLGIFLKEPIKYFQEKNINNKNTNNNIKEKYNEKDNKDNIDEITIIYEIKKENKKVSNEIIEEFKKLGETISEKKIFGENFVKNNKNKIKIIVKERKKN